MLIISSFNKLQLLIKQRKEWMTSSRYGPIILRAKYVLQWKKTKRSFKQNSKIFLSTDYFLQFENMKKESSVIAYKHGAVNMCFDLEQTACHVLEVCLLKKG